MNDAIENNISQEINDENPPSNPPKANQENEDIELSNIINEQDQIIGQFLKDQKTSNLFSSKDIAYIRIAAKEMRK